ncbi:BTAD domain-containing putative transcriptional regulator [Streptomyces sp. HPF1205]|uniref:AfsR/SARP family transcriptional regulator n=1 Tax=Streptomyces sp. HPF1205 TaxID=2873262 RepID=UPI001CEDEB77|nr:BTAD domain-containing putative transcriptional regulator [Streptomyces sp. HPF1205]
MRFRILGPMEIEGSAGPGVSYAPRAAKLRVVLGSLLVHNREVVSVAALTDELWQGGPPRTATTTLQVYVSQVRKQLDAAEDGFGRKALVTRQPGYLLRLDPDQLDLTRFEALHAGGRRAMAAGDFARASALQRRALELWRGPLLSDTPRGPVLEAAAVRLDEAAVAALEQRIRADLALGRHGELIPELGSVARRYPLREEFHGLLMLALFRAGRQAEALNVFTRLRGNLIGELAIEPCRRLQRLHVRILAGDERLLSGESGRHGPAAVTAPAARPVLLPAAGPALTGRERELAQVVDLVTSAPAGVCVAVAGMPGVGKTALAVAAAHRCADAFPDGRVFLDLEPEPGRPLTDEQALTRLLRRVGATGPLPEDADDLRDVLHAVLAGRRLLLVLDHAHREAQLRPLLATTGDCRVLATMRRTPAYLPAVRTVSLSPLPPEAARALLVRATGLVTERPRVPGERAWPPAPGLPETEPNGTDSGGTGSDRMNPDHPGPEAADPDHSTLDTPDPDHTTLDTPDPDHTTLDTTDPDHTALDRADPDPTALDRADGPARAPGARTSPGGARPARGGEPLYGPGPAAALTEIAMLCGGLPLALRAVAAQLAARPHWTPRILLARLRAASGRLDALRMGELDVRASLMSAYTAAPADRREAFRLLALLPDAPFGPGWAAAALGLPTGAAGHLVEALVDARLLEAEAGGRYRFHPLMRLLAGELLAEDEPADSVAAAAGRVADAYAEALAAAGPAAAFPDPGPAAHVGVLRTAHAHGAWRPALRLADALSGCLAPRAAWPQWHTAHTLGLDAARRTGDRAGEARMLCSLGELAWQQRRLEHCEELYEAAARTARAAPGPAADELGRALVGLADVRLDAGAHDEAGVLLDRALATVPELSPARADALRTGALLALARGEHALAAARFAACRDLAGVLRDRRLEAYARRCLRRLDDPPRRSGPAVEVRPGVWRLRRPV